MNSLIYFMLFIDINAVRVCDLQLWTSEHRVLLKIEWTIARSVTEYMYSCNYNNILTSHLHTFPSDLALKDKLRSCLDI